MILSLHLAVARILAFASAADGAHGIVRRDGTGFPLATSISVPAGADIVLVSGTLADAADPSAPPRSPERIGDTAAQASSELGKIAAKL